VDKTKRVSERGGVYTDLRERKGNEGKPNTERRSMRTLRDTFGTAAMVRKETEECPIMKREKVFDQRELVHGCGRTEPRTENSWKKRDKKKVTWSVDFSPNTRGGNGGGGKKKSDGNW